MDATLTQRGYDPHAMTWETITTSETPNSASSPRFRSQAINDAVERRSQANAKKAASAAAPASDTPADKTQPLASHAVGRKGKVLTKWKPRPFPKSNPDDYVIVVKPRECISLHDAFSENWYGTAFKAYLGPERAETLTVIPSREQNLIVIHTPDPDTADKIIGDFAVNIEHRQVLLNGYLRQDGSNVCHGVIVVRNTDTTETLRESVRWRSGTIVEVRKFGTSNKARVTFAGKEKPRFVHYDTMLIPVKPYYRTIPACGKCGVVGHRMDTCPNPRPDTCGLCGQQVPLVEEGVRAPHECVPVCSVCGGAHATNSRACTAKYRNSKVAAQQGGKSKRASKKRRKHQTPSEPPRREVAKTDKPASPTGGIVKQPSTPPHGGTGKQPTAQPCGEAGSWANAVKNGNQVGGTGRAASSSPPIIPSSSPNADQNIIAKLQAQIEALQKRLAAAEAKQTQLVSPPPPPAVEVMESETGAAATDAVAALEAHVNTLEVRMDSRITVLETQISAAVNAAIAKMTETIPTLIAQQVARFTKRAGPIKDVSGRYLKTPRRQIDFEDDDSCSISGFEDTPLPASAGSGAPPPQSLVNSTDHGGHP
ncbi:uncharacterized protein LOC125757771 [Rhipicephalus sanguineus]|uniref:uncharacterized protein LOC125757771 n=1 Tax=Rhipicephalus sanguineus TaxID=34632 RepID=UPI0020C1BBA4|nr:uncharacterized protein LOC125757771 [Rhipicephalus sanguineus]